MITCKYISIKKTRMMQHQTLPGGNLSLDSTSQSGSHALESRQRNSGPAATESCGIPGGINHHLDNKSLKKGEEDYRWTN